jgi:hypothetical protein
MRCPGNSGHSFFKQPPVVGGSFEQTPRGPGSQGASGAVGDDKKFQWSPEWRTPLPPGFHNAGGGLTRFLSCPRSFPSAHCRGNSPYGTWRLADHARPAFGSKRGRNTGFLDPKGGSIQALGAGHGWRATTPVPQALGSCVLPGRSPRSRR